MTSYASTAQVLTGESHMISPITKYATYKETTKIKTSFRTSASSQTGSKVR